MVKKVFSLITIVTFITLVTVSVFGSFNFDRGYDSGSILPYDDARAYTSCNANAFYDNEGNLYYDNTCNVKVVLWNGTQSKTGTDSGTDRSYYDTGWITYSGIDHATKVDHTGSYRDRDGVTYRLQEVIGEDL